MTKQSEQRRLIQMNDSKPMPVVKWTKEQIAELNKQLNPGDNHIPAIKLKSKSNSNRKGWPPLTPEMIAKREATKARKRELGLAHKPGPKPGLKRTPEAIARQRETLARKYSLNK